MPIPCVRRCAAMSTTFGERRPTICDVTQNRSGDRLRVHGVGLVPHAV